MPFAFRVTAASLACLGLLLPGDLVAQDAPTDVSAIYHEHSATAAGLIEWFLPTAGYAYGGNWTNGFLSNAVRIGSFIGFGMTSDSATDTCDDACAAWAVAWLGSTAWAIVGAVSTAKEHNARVRAATEGLTVGSAPFGGVSVGLTLRR